MIELDNETSLEVDEDFLNTIASCFTNKDIELIVTTNEEIKAINLEHRGIDKATDVLSFPYEDMPMVPLGTIVIAQEFVEQKAQELGHSNKDEFTLLFIHGLLHLLGFDHEVDNGEMRAKEEQLIKKYNLPKSLIVRVEG
jgi:probable rRNA maturation factor